MLFFYVSVTVLQIMVLRIFLNFFISADHFGHPSTSRILIGLVRIKRFFSKRRLLKELHNTKDDCSNPFRGTPLQNTETIALRLDSHV